MQPLKRSIRFYDTSRFGQPEIRVYHKKGQGKRGPRYLLKCGCCEERLEIYYTDDGLEIGGVNGAIEDWREILLPLLRIEENKDALRDISYEVRRAPARPPTRRRGRRGGRPR